MKKNASSQIVGAQMASATDGSNFTGTVTCYVTGDNGAQALGTVGSGVCTHKGNGFHTYTPSSAETNYNHIGFTFIGSGAISATTQVYTTQEISETIWGDLTASYSGAGTFGKRLGDLAGMVTSSGTAQSGGTQTITLEAGAPAYNFCDPGVVLIVGGTGAGQSREIVDYNTGTKVVTVARAFRVSPDNTSVYVTLPSGSLVHSNEGIAAAGGASTITLNSTAPSGDDSIKGQTIWITGGTGQDQANVILSYNGTTKVATMTQAWVTAPDATSIYTLLPFGPSMPFDYNTGKAPLQPTVAGRTLDVTAGGEAGIDWNNIGTPGATQNLSATTIATVTNGVTVAVGGIGATSIAAAGLNAIADGVLDRNMATGTDSGNDSNIRTVRQALRSNRNRVAISAGTLTVYKEDDATTSHTAVVTTAAGNPISSLDPP